MAILSDDHQTFISVLDGVPVGLAFYDEHGALVHRNRTLRRILAEHKGEQAVQKEIDSVVRDVCSRLTDDSNPGIQGPQALEDLTPREVCLAEKRYRLRVGFTGMELFGHGSSVIVTLDHERDTAEVSDDQLKEQFGLTQREIRVARLLANGYTNAKIADQLYISPHTARRHTEKILKKLNVPTRAQVASLLSGAQTSA